MREQAGERANVQAKEHDVASGTYYTLLILAGLLSGAAGFALPLCWLVTGLCFVLILAGRGAQQDRAQHNNPDVSERATGCGKWAVLGLLAGAAFFVALLGGLQF